MSREINILYGEDNDYWIDYVRDLCEKNDIRFDVAKDGDEVWKKYINNAPDLLLLDLEMPGKDVLDVIRDVNILQDKTPIAVFSVHARSDRAVAAVRMGIEDFFDKSFNGTLLVERLKCIVAKSRQEMDNPNLFVLSEHTSYDYVAGTLAVNGTVNYLRRLDSVLLRFLAIRFNQWADKEYLCLAMWGVYTGQELKKYVTHLRKMLNTDPELVISNRFGGWYALLNSEGKRIHADVLKREGVTVED